MATAPPERSRAADPRDEGPDHIEAVRAAEDGACAGRARSPRAAGRRRRPRARTAGWTATASTDPSRSASTSGSVASPATTVTGRPARPSSSALRRSQTNAVGSRSTAYTVGPGRLGGDGGRDGPRSGAQVHHHGAGPAAEPGQGPADEHLGLRPGDEDALAHLELEVTKRRRPGQVLQRDPSRPLPDQLAEPPDLPGSRLAGHHQPAAGDAEHIREQQLGIDPGRHHPGGLQCGCRLRDQLGDPHEPSITTRVGDRAYGTGPRRGRCLRSQDRALPTKWAETWTTAERARSRRPAGRPGRPRSARRARRRGPRRWPGPGCTRCSRSGGR